MTCELYLNGVIKIMMGYLGLVSLHNHVHGRPLSTRVPQVNEHIYNFHKTILLIAMKLKIHMNRTTDLNHLDHG